MQHVTMTAEQPQAQKQRQQGHRIKGTTAARTVHFIVVHRSAWYQVVKCGQ